MSKSRRRSTVISFWQTGIAAVFAFVSFSAEGAAFTWDGGSFDDNWSTGQNWVGDVAPPTASLANDFHFAGTVRLMPFAQSAYSMNSLTFDAGAGAFTLSGATLTLGVGGITQNSANGQTINNAIVLAGAQTWTVSSGAGALNLGSTIDNGGFGLTVNAASGTNATFVGGISGSGGLTTNGAGTITLAGANTYTGSTSVTSGTLTLASGASVGQTSISVGTGGTLNINGSINAGASNFTLDGNAGNAPVANLSATGSLATGNTFVGIDGSGSFVQSGGNHSVSTAFYLGMNAGSNGTYTLSGGSLSSSGAIVGVFGTGSFTQTSGTHTVGNNFLYIGYGAGSSGTYNQSGGTLSSYTTIVGNGGSGTFTQSGGDAFADNGLYVGYSPGSTGTYNLSAGTVSAGVSIVGLDGPGNFNLSGSGILSSGGEFVGLGSGTGTFTQTGGTHTINSAFYLGYNSGSTGNYTLNSGSLSTDFTVVGVSGNSTFTQNGGTHVDKTNLLVGYNAGGTGTYNLNAGSLAPGYLSVGVFGTGNFNHAGGSVATEALYLGGAAGANGTYTLSNGTLTTNLTHVGSGGTGTFNQTGGTHTIGVAPGSALVLGWAAGTNGTYNLSGGTLTTPATYVGNDGAGIFNQTGGTAISSSVILGATAAASGIYNLNGGTLNTGGIFNGTGSGTFNFNGGLLQASQSYTTFMSGLTVANVKTGGANIDTNGFNITIAQPLLHDTTVGAPATDGGLTKLGAGTLTLSGANTYRGTTSINAGTLAVTGTLNGATGTGLTFAGNGTANFNQAAGTTQNMGALNFAAGNGTVQSIYGGSGNTAVIFSSLVLNPGATGNFVVSGGTNGTTNKIVLNGQAAGFIDASIFYGGNEYAWYDASGYVRAVNYGVDPGTSFSSGGATLIGDHVKTNGSITDQGTERIETLHIDGNITITMGSNKKLTTNSILKTGNVAGTATITSGNQIDSDFNASLFVRTDQINDAVNIVTPIVANGTNALVKDGAGTLTLSGNNTYTGGTIINQGTLQIGANERLLNTGALTVNGGTFSLQAFNETVGAVALKSGSITGTGTLTGSSFTMESGSASAILAGTAALTKNTTGTVVLSGANTYTGGSTINSGTLVVNSSASLGAIGGGLTINAGTLEIATGFSTSRSITLNNAASTFLVDLAQTYTVTSGIVGAGMLNKNGTGTMVLSGNNSFSGGTNVLAGTLRIGANERLFNSGALNVSGGTFDVQTFNETTGVVTLASGAITGSGSGSLTGSSFEMQSGSVSAILAGSGPLLKTTSGTVTFTGANTYAGGTNVMAGTLRTGANERLANSGALTVSGGTFDVQTFGETVGAVVLSSGVIDGTGAGAVAGSSFNVQSGSANAILAGNAGLTKTTGGTVTLAGANTYSAGTDVRAGTLQISANERLLNSGTLTVSGGTFNVQTFSETVSGVTLKSGAINGSGTGTVIGSSFNVQSGSASAILAGAVAAMTKNTSGTVTLTGANTFAGSTTINAGTLVVAATSGAALGNTPAIFINSGGNLLLGANDQINNIASMTLAGGTFSKGNFGEGSTVAPGLGALNLTAPGGTIDFGVGTVGALTFTSFNPATLSLVIDNWTGTANTLGDASADRLVFQSDQTGNLSNFMFTGYSGATQFSLGGGYYEITPLIPAVPETNPGFAASIFCALLSIFAHARAVVRRRQS